MIANGFSWVWNTLSNFDTTTIIGAVVVVFVALKLLDSD